MRLFPEDSTMVLDILLSPDCHGTVGDDNTSKAGLSAYVVDMLCDPRVYLLQPDPGAIFFFLPINSVCYETHVAMLKSSRGNGFVSAEKAARWIFENTKCVRLVAFIPASHQSSIMFAAQCGMTGRGFLPAAFLFGGKLHDLHVFSAAKDELFASWAHRRKKENTSCLQ